MKFLEAARKARDEAMGHLSGTTQQDLSNLLREHGRIGATFSEMELGDINAEAIRGWTQSNSELSLNTQDKYLYAMGFVFRWALEHGLVSDDPVAHFRRAFRKKHSKSIRAAKDPARNIRPLSKESQYKVLEAAFAESPYRYSAFSFLLLMLDAGLRVGEAVALRWENVGEEFLEVCENCPRYSHIPVLPKSGYRRRVEMSKRLREHLKSLRGLDQERVIHPIHYPTFLKKTWPVILESAGLKGVRLKDLRDTYASTLLSCGIPIAYIAKQMGHSNVNVTARHYAQWIHDGWKPPVQLKEGRIPADLLAIVSGDDYED